MFRSAVQNLNGVWRQLSTVFPTGQGFGWVDSMLLELVPRTNLRKYITSSSLQYVSSNMWKAGKLKEVQARACVAMKARSNMPSKMRHGHGRDRRGHTSLRKENLKQMQKSGCKKAGAMSTDKQMHRYIK